LLPALVAPIGCDPVGGQEFRSIRRPGRSIRPASIGGRERPGAPGVFPMTALFLVIWSRAIRLIVGIW